MCVRMTAIDCSRRTPLTPPRAPVIPTSVMYAVPPGRTRASAVGTCVCVPTTAVTRPSRYQPIATLSPPPPPPCRAGARGVVAGGAWVVLPGGPGQGRVDLEERDAAGPQEHVAGE